MLGGPARQGGVAPREKLKVPEIDAVEAQRFAVVDLDHIPIEERPAAFGTVAVVAGEEDHDFAGGAW